jgi:hypothetical protein
LPKIQNMVDSEFKLVEKEEVASFHFPEEEVLVNESDRKFRKSELERAISLGNIEHLKVKIYFADDKSEKLVNTTIWAITDNAILLKKNVVIPIRRIIKLEI